MDKKIENLIISLPLWNNNIKIKKIDGGITNQNFLLQIIQKNISLELEMIFQNI